MQESTPNVTGMAKLLAGLLEMFTGKSADETVVAGTNDAAAAAAADAAVTADVAGEAVEGKAEVVAEPSIADQVAAGVTAGLQPLMDVISALTPAAAVDGMADGAAAATADADEGAVADTATADAAADASGDTVDVAAGECDTDTEAVEEPVVPSLTGMSDEDADNFNKLFGTLLTGMNTINANVSGLAARIESQAAEINELKLVGKADGASTQVSPAGTTPTNVARADRSVGIQGFVTGTP